MVNRWEFRKACFLTTVIDEGLPSGSIAKRVDSEEAEEACPFGCPQP